ncbi:MAG: type I glyceraldehyde-3-phosphate dehydrogenase [Deltaproteobacteria bacterium]|nr:type I glyceraldehyde-3-phosphate dehydrogenase [Deltaproteobacteria bacterium]
MGLRIAINGFGRIGRNVTRAIVMGHNDIELIAANDMSSPDELARLLKYDSVHGTLPKDVRLDGQTIVVDGRKIKTLCIKEIPSLPWKELGVDIVIESTGLFRDRSDAGKHLEAGAKKVIISAPGKEVDATFVLGVNENTYQPAKHHVVSNASCTTNCLAPVAKVLNDSFGVVHGLMTTVHSYTMDQRLMDSIHKDPRRSRAAALSMIPTTTGAAKAVTLVIPELAGKLDGLAIRVPTPNVSIVDLVAELRREVTVDEVNGALKAAAEGPMKGLLLYSTEPLVSIDFNTTPYSSIVDAPLTKVIDKKMVKIMSWYDNEYGYSNRLVDLAVYMGKSL